MRFVGGDHAIADAALKVTGGLVYATDFVVPGMVHAKLVFSPLAHARVAHVDASAALALPGVLGVFWHRDAPARRFNRFRTLPNQPCVEDELVFADVARFAGDRVAAVVARDDHVAERAAALVRVEYEELPPVLTTADAMSDDAVAIHSGGNIVHEFETVTPGDPRSASGDVRVAATVSTPRVHHAALEPHICLADRDEDGKITIWSPTQSVFGARTVVADLLGMDYSQVRVIKLPMGGSFGGKQEFILEPVAALLAMKTGRPVRLALDREECIASTMVRGATRTELSLALTPSGMLREVEAETVADAGAYATSSPDYTEMMAHKLPRLYRMEGYRHRARVVYTTTPVAGGARAWGAPEITVAMEIAMDLAAAELAVDPVELRLRNLVKPGDTDPLTGMTLGDARVRDCLTRGAEAFGWRARVGLHPGRGRLRRAVGMACGAHKNGILSPGFPDYSTMAMKMNEDGSAALTTSLHEVGCGALTTMRLIAAEELGIEPRRVVVTEADSDLTPYDFGCYGSRVTYVCGEAARRTAAALRERLTDVTAAVLRRPVAELRARDGKIEAVTGEPVCLSYGEAVMAAKLLRSEDVAVQYTHRATSNPGAYSVQFAEVEVDRWTGLTRVTDFLAVGDVGRAINRRAVVGQFQGAVHMGIGFALCEEVKLDEAGVPAPYGFKNYHTVNAPDMPDVRVLLVEHPGDEGPYGAKSVGEIATVPTAPAVVNAVNRALGTRLHELPLTPEKVLAALA